METMKITSKQIITGSINIIIFFTILISWFNILSLHLDKNPWYLRFNNQVNKLLEVHSYTDDINPLITSLNNHTISYIIPIFIVNFLFQFISIMIFLIINNFMRNKNYFLNLLIYYELTLIISCTFIMLIVSFIQEYRPHVLIVPSLRSYLYREALHFYKSLLILIDTIIISIILLLDTIYFSHYVRKKKVLINYANYTYGSITNRIL